MVLAMFPMDSDRRVALILLFSAFREIYAHCYRGGAGCRRHRSEGGRAAMSFSSYLISFPSFVFATSACCRSCFPSVTSSADRLSSVRLTLVCRSRFFINDG